MNELATPIMPQSYERILARTIRLQGDPRFHATVFVCPRADRPGAPDLPRITHDITFDRVTFQYEGGETPVLNNLSLKFDVGKRIAIVGPSGSGKSTLLNLILRLRFRGGGHKKSYRIVDFKAPTRGREWRCLVKSRNAVWTTTAIAQHRKGAARRQGMSPGQAGHKWHVFRNICEARTSLPVSDRALAVLNALLSFHPDTVLTAGAADLVVFPSNRLLSLRAHGMAASTLRRHLAGLVDSGLVLRRDSPNGKRYARKATSGDIEQAFGFDLGPIVARADEFAALAEAAIARRQALTVLRERITLARRDIAKMIATGVEQRGAADWGSLHRTFRDIMARLPRAPTCEVLEPIVVELAILAETIVGVLERHLDPIESGPPNLPADQIPNSAPQRPNSSEPDPRPGAPETADADRPQSAGAIPIRMVVELCPDIIDYARDGIRTSQDLITTASAVRPMLGISPSAWEEACTAMGDGQASVVLAAILQRGAAIKSPGGYLRVLARRAAAGEFSVWPMLMALRRQGRAARDRDCLPSSFPDDFSQG
ncbi:replication protein C (plasmid) [Nitrobacter hamburgensis X14]|uniref:Replication protein C n=1 Tax=Nitrobacter hamburgensis (strain DSM 10229 / NCIMB 13809 / X14) TaxID=323097 RepID=Q1QF94_NITHX|nr:replication protein C [Nitrobacter hamburgensis X14]